MSSLGSYLREHRGEKTLGQISATSGIDKGYLSKVERDERNPKPDMLAKLAQAYDVDYNKLMAAAGYLDNDDFFPDAHGPQYDSFLEQNSGDVIAAKSAYLAFLHAEAEDAQKEAPHRRKLRSVSRLEEIDINDSEDEQLNDFIDFLLSKRDKDKK